MSRSRTASAQSLRLAYFPLGVGDADVRVGDAVGVGEVVDREAVGVGLGVELDRVLVGVALGFVVVGRMVAPEVLAVGRRVGRPVDRGRCVVGGR